ncbi:MAG: Fic family protein [Phenylobacterium sp.]|uniref:Fic family protein n=1 Tax=Phenylobacterium sp. TaxID=1871053 RepID=UPI0025DABFA1|nr:Fic family protein [Phenylobacterium sp.]MCA3759003.1 Fic family protein [Phenylobacterium sp.]MCA6237205.1 Fic family protein [Phenylobacterium sp.]
MSDRGGRYEAQLAGYKAFVPAPLPPVDPPFNLTGEIARLLSEADRALAELKGSTRTLPNADLFVAMYVRKEAVLSSQIEGTQSSLDDILRAEAELNSPGAPRDVGEVLNYIAALNYGLARLKELPVSGRLIKEIHERLMRGVRGGEKSPGEFRTGQVHIGPMGASVRDATFVPPPPEHVPTAIHDLERFIHEERELPPLVRIGLAHAQFETVHPFHDGNGRTGRLLITFLLCAEGLLDKPVLYLSYFLRAHRAEYYEALQATRDRGDYEGWIRFFLTGVAEVARQAAEVAAQIIDLREGHRTMIGDAYDRGSKHAFALLDFLFKRPVVMANEVRDSLGISGGGARNLINRFVELGILIEITGYERNKAFEYAPYTALFGDLSGLGQANPNRPT